MKPRIRLGELELTRARKHTRALLGYGAAAAAALATAGYLLPAHRTAGEAAYHSYYADGGSGPLVVLLAVMAVTFALRKRALGAGILAGLIGVGGTILALSEVLLTHMFQTVEYASGELLFVAGILGGIALGAALAISEPILYLLERRVRERHDPKLPVARALA